MSISIQIIEKIISELPFIAAIIIIGKDAVVLFHGEAMVQGVNKIR